MRRFLVLLKKEVSELITPQFLLPFLLTALLFAGIGNLVGDQGEQTRASAKVLVLDLDSSAESRALLDAIDKAGLTAETVQGVSPSAMPHELTARGVGLGMVIPAGFGEGVLSGKAQQVQTFVTIHSMSLTATQDASRLKGVLAAVNDTLSTQLIALAAPGSDPRALKNPVGFSETVIVGTRNAKISSEEVLGFMAQQMTFIPIVLFVVIVFATQMIATTIASEKENKTLETLLSSPVSRGALVTAKMCAAGFVALLSAAAYMIGMRYYINGMTKGFGGSATVSPSAAMDSLGLTLHTGQWVVLGVSMFLAILVALAIAMVLGAFAENVKAAQSLMAPLMIFIMIPYFMTMFVDLDAAGTALKWGVMAIPFTHAFTAAPNLMLGNYRQVAIGIGYEAVWVVALIVVAARIFSTDRILTMRLNLKRKKRR